MKNTCSEKSLTQLVHLYTQAAQLADTSAVKTQIHVVQMLKSIGTPATIEQLGRLMVNAPNHEYMDFALPDALAELLPQSELQPIVVAALVQGVLHGQNETLQTTCIRKLLQVGYFPLYPILIDYRNFLLLDLAHRPSYWASLLSTITDAITTLHPYINLAHQIDMKKLWLNQSILD
ncbi:MAG: hypothetical protein EA368_13840 [Leptolyngbya sp. DLM2.Bin27]|nr:MAG: hypothetical protein EA368_13840 [Leptolyngbya sp. DLM2.Bin27]